MSSATTSTTLKSTSAARRLIVNADDFGFNREITDGIVDSHHNGIVTSTTLMINMPAATYAVERASDCPDMSIGLHINLTAGKPLSDPAEIPSLVGAEGMFLDPTTFYRRANLCKFDASHLELEMRTQIEKILDAGLTPTHADSHHHAASCVQPFFVKLNLLKEYGIDKMRSQRGWYRADKASDNPLRTRIATLKKNFRRAPFRAFYEVQHLICKLRRIRTPTERYGFFKIVSDRKMDFRLDCLQSVVRTMPVGVNELCCHPGYPNEDPNDEPDFRPVRPKELKFLTDPTVRAAIEESDIELISYRDF